MNTDKQHISINDITFEPIGSDELKIVQSCRNRALLEGFTRRAIISVIIITVIMISEYIGRYNLENPESIPGAFIFLIIALALFNVLSLGYMRLKQRIDIFRDHLSFVYGTVTEKYDSHSLEKQNRQKSNNYILFDTETVHCTTGVPVSDYAEFKNLEFGSKVLIVRSSPYGDSHYEFYPIL